MYDSPRAMFHHLRNVGLEGRACLGCCCPPWVSHAPFRPPMDSVTQMEEISYTKNPGPKEISSKIPWEEKYVTTISFQITTIF